MTRRRGVTARDQGGFTLIELLVSMVILGFVMTLVSQAVFQVGQIVRVADQAGQQLGDRWSRGWALGPLMANLVVPKEGRDRPFVGGLSSIEAYSTQPLIADPHGVEPVRLQLRASVGGRPGMDLLATSGSQQGEGRAVARFDASVEFTYRGQDGQWVGQWPSPGSSSSGTATDREWLPNAVGVREVASGRFVIVYSVSPGDGSQLLDKGSPLGLGGS